MPIHFRLALHLSSCLLCALTSAAIADECEQLPQPSVTLKRIASPVTMNLTYSYGSLTNIGRELAAPGTTVLGLTRGNAIVRFETKIPAYVDRSGRYECASPQLTVYYGFKPMTLYVAREFPPGSCAHKEIFEHEQRHVKIYEGHLDAIEKGVQATLNQRFATGTPWRGLAGQASSQLQSELDSRWLPYITSEIKRVNTAQSLIDTPAEYDRIMKSCNGEIQNKINQKQ